MAILPLMQLINRSVAEARTTLEALVDAEMVFMPGLGDTEWNSSLRRQVHSQPMAVWRLFDEVELVLTPDGRPMRFHDKARMEAPGEGKPLTEAELVGIARTSGLLDDDIRVVAVEPGKLTKLILWQSKQPQEMHFVIHPALKQIAAFDAIYKD